MSEEKKLAKRLGMFKQFDEATIVATATTNTKDYRDLKASNEGMERPTTFVKRLMKYQRKTSTQRQLHTQNEPRNKFSNYSWIDY